jgi:hypothetical protein
VAHDDGVWDAFDGRPHQLRMGLSRLAPTAWIRLLQPGVLGPELERKASLLRDRRQQVLGAIDDPGVPAAAVELRARLVEHLTTTHRARYAQNDSTLTLLDDHRSWDCELEPLELAGRVVSEDWCLIRPSEPPVLAAATVCSPNRWRLADKLGRPVTEIHDPVPGYRKRLGPTVDAVFAGRRGPLCRRNWSIQSSPSRFQPVADGPERPSVPDQVWVRSEYETLVLLPVTGWWVFGIHTTIRPLADVADRPDVAARMETAVATLDSTTAAYKALAVWRADLLAWLAAVGACTNG